MPANYDNASWFYERLSQLVFGNNQLKAQEYFLDLVEPGSSVLIIGGGTGQILESLTNLYESGLNITYVELSANMMELSRKRNVGQNTVTYLTGDVKQIALKEDFDVIITAFLFDNFTDRELAKAFLHINQYLKPDGLWLNTDFQLTGPVWQKVMLKAMFLFFKILRAVEVTQLPGIEKVFAHSHYNLIAEKTFYKNFITSKAYKKPAL